MPTRYELFVNDWKSCTACDLHHGRLSVVQARGSIPCDILFVGEAPGESENVIGKPFKGPAGRVLDHIVARAVPPTTLYCSVCGSLQFQTPGGLCCKNGHGGADGHPLTWAMTNLVCCIPRDEDGDKISEPHDDAIEACAVRLTEFVAIARPRLLVGVGRLAGDWLTPGFSHSITFYKKIPLVAITHPAAILRANVANQGLSVQRCIVTIANAIEEYLT